MTISKRFTFEASHILPHHSGKCARLHGHSWVLTVTVAGPINPKSGFVVDFYELGNVVNEHIIDHLDHSHLGKGTMVASLGMGYTDGPEFNSYFGREFYPTSENLVMAIARILNPLIPELPNASARLIEVRLAETCTSEAIWRCDAS